MQGSSDPDAASSFGDPKVLQELREKVFREMLVGSVSQQVSPGKGPASSADPPKGSNKGKIQE